MKRYIIDADDFRFKEKDCNVFIQATNNLPPRPVKVLCDDYVNYLNPPIPPGYQYLKGEPVTGFVIQSIDSDFEFTWVPVGMVESKGLFLFDSYKMGSYGSRFTSPRYEGKFGSCGALTCYGDYGPYTSIANDPFYQQLKSVKKYGGFYISSYHIHTQFIREDVPKDTNWRMLKPPKKRYFSLRGLQPTLFYPNLLKNLNEVFNALNSQNKYQGISYHLPYLSEHDFMLEWISETNDMQSAIYKDSSKIGNYSGRLLLTGSNEKYCINNIYDITGNLPEWTREFYSYSWYTHEYFPLTFEKHEAFYDCMLRGGGYNEKGNIHPAACKRTPYSDSDGAAARIAMYIE